MAHERVTPPRLAALEAMRQIRAGVLADRAMEVAATGLDPRDRAWALELVYGTLRARGRIDHLLAQLVRAGLDSLDADVLDILRLGAYQLLEMGSVPTYAAVSQSVELARAAGHGRASGLVNGVLQSLRRQKDTLEFPDPEADPIGDLTTRGSHPRWIVERWVAAFGLEGTRALVTANNTRPEPYLTVPDVEPSEVVSRLAEAAVEVEPVDFAPGSFRVTGGGVRDALAAVPGVIQDPAAWLVVRYADVPAGADAIDLCAAPGGKTIGLAARAARVVAADIAPGRLARVRENVARLGLDDRVEIVTADARQADFDPADLVLLDAPCTGTGTFRRHPDGRWRIAPEDLRQLIVLQQELLDAAAQMVKPGGILVYSTCSLEPEENEDRVREFLADHGDFEFAVSEGAVEDSLIDADGFLRVLPQKHGVDGAFAARLRRRA